MAPADMFEVVAVDAEADFYFHVSYHEKGVTVYAEGHATQLSVYHSDRLLSCGHNRRKETW